MRSYAGQSTTKGRANARRRAGTVSESSVIQRREKTAPRSAARAVLHDSRPAAGPPAAERLLHVHRVGLLELEDVLDRAAEKSRQAVRDDEARLAFAVLDRVDRLPGQPDAPCDLRLRHASLLAKPSQEVLSHGVIERIDVSNLCQSHLPPP